MAARAGKDAKVDIGGNTMAGTRSWSCPEALEMIDITDHLDEYRSFIAGLSSWTARVEGYYDGATGGDTAQIALNTARENKTSVTLNLYLDGTYYLTGTAFVSGMDIAAPIGGDVTVSYSFQGSGALTLT